MRLDLVHPVPFQLHVVVIVQVVEPDHGLAPVEERAADVISDESGGAGDENHEIWEAWVAIADQEGSFYSIIIPKR